MVSRLRPVCASGQAIRAMSILATLVIAPSHAYGAEYSFEPSVVWRNELNDNYRYNTQSKQSAWISTIAPEMRAVRNTETGMIGVGAGFANDVAGE